MSTRIWKEQRKLVGGCIRCLKPAIPGKTLCQFHRKEYAKHRRAWEPEFVRIPKHNLGKRWHCMACRNPSDADLCDRCTEVLRTGCPQRERMEA